ncbi:MAG TPA: TraR/DksA family transcriptional regulator [Terriglobales bacterium]|nr:TraR/DksA family transcriptional regulator [Terriglobales bacterium]
MSGGREGSMKAMTGTDAEQYRERLEDLRQEALRLLDRWNNDMRSVENESSRDSGDQCISHLTRESLYLSASQRRTLLRKVEAALERLRQGTYGMCNTCGDEIQPRRLEALPWTDCCLGCQQDRERDAASPFSPDPHGSWRRAA